ncbi:MAG: L,D-transpeptidase [Solirubrobacterales bacterium]|nr:L,D-transpeptidase [Solirubrobacterales bacterium]
MIDRTQLSQALARLDPRDREVLDYSLRRHVPDADLAAVFDCGPSEVARMRAAAVERLADDLGVQRGADLGQVLTALLDEQTWAEVPGAEPLSAGGPPPAPAPEPAAAAERAGEAAAPADPAGPAPSRAAATAAAADEPARPVLGMLSGRGREQQAPPPSRPREAARSGRRWTLVAAALIGALITVGLGSVVLLGEDGGADPATEAADATRPFSPQGAGLGEPFASEPPAEAATPRYPIATIDRRTTLYDGPGGQPKLRIEPRTEWGSERVLSVVESRAGWVAVLVPELPNGEVGWLAEADAAGLDTVGWAIRADLAAREVVVERDGEEIRRFAVGIGRADHPTPTGRFAVTDKLRVNDPDSPYGCCVVALTGHQTELPAGWPGGDRLAIHATNDPDGIGGEVSLGCLRADPGDARWLMNSVPLGTPVFIESGDAEAPAPKPTRKTTSQKQRQSR